MFRGGLTLRVHIICEDPAHVEHILHLKVEGNLSIMLWYDPDWHKSCAMTVIQCLTSLEKYCLHAVPAPILCQDHLTMDAK